MPGGFSSLPFWRWFLPSYRPFDSVSQLLTQAGRQCGATAGQRPDHHAIDWLERGQHFCGDVPKAARHTVAYYCSTYRLSDDQTDLGTLSGPGRGALTAALEVNHQVGVGTSRSTLDGLPEFG